MKRTPATPRFQADGTLALAGHDVAWELRLLCPRNGERLAVRPRDLRTAAQTLQEDRLVQFWQGHPRLGGAFQVVCEWRRRGAQWRGRLRYQGNASDFEVDEVVFPVLRLTHGDDRLMVPHDVGFVSGPLRDWERGLLAAPVRCSLYPFQCFAAFSRTGNLYAACLDARHWNKSYEIVAAQGRRPAAELRVAIPVPQTPATRRRWRVPFETALQECGPSWCDAARLYAAWAHRQAWHRRRLRDNPLRDAAIWFWNRGKAEEVLAPVEEFIRRAGVPAALDWYFWHRIPYDTSYPDFWPPREGEAAFRRAARRARDAGVFLQTYINGVIWDPENPDWTDGGPESAVEERGGIVHRVPFNRYNRHSLAYMCGEAAPFQRKIERLVGRLADAGVPSVYLDLIGCASFAVPCHNPRHRHAPGGGDYQAEGYRAFVQRLRKAFPRTCFGTEQGSEAYLDLMESMILLYGSHERIGHWDLALRMKGDYQPVFTALYHGSTALFGNFAIPDGRPAWDELWPEAERFPPDREEPWAALCPDQFPLEFARGLVWGMQPTVVNLRPGMADDPLLKPYYDFIVAAARFYYENRAWLFAGRQLPPGVLDAPVRKVLFLRRATYSKPAEIGWLESEAPAVLHSCWRRPDGKNALFLVNWSRDDAPWRWGRRTGTMPPRSCLRIDLAPREVAADADMDYSRQVRRLSEAEARAWAQPPVSTPEP